VTEIDPSDIVMKEKLGAGQFGVSCSDNYSSMLAQSAVMQQ